MPLHAKRRFARMGGACGLWFFAAVLTGLHGLKAQASVSVRIDGSSTLFPLTEALVEEFQNAGHKGARITVGISGTGGGFKKFCRGETELQAASRPISQEEMKACRVSGVSYIELPVAFDAITLVVNPSNPVDVISIDELRRIWGPAAQGKILNWRQVRPDWPDLPLKLYGAGADSGTFDYFTEAVNGKAKSSRGDFTASEDDNTLVQGVSSDRGALGFVPFAYYESNRSRLKALAIIGNKEGRAVLPSQETASSGAYAPLARPLFLYLNAKARAQRDVSDFTVFYLDNAERLARELKYVPLPKEAYATSKRHLHRARLGTVFHGHAQTGLTIEEILKRDASQ